MAEFPPYPLYNRSYLLYRVSPLLNRDAPLLNERNLRTHAQRLRNQLKGDNIRGVEVDYPSIGDALPNLGPLEDCSWDILPDEDEWINRQRYLVDPDASQISSSVPPERARGLGVTLEYEKQSYNALLLRDPGTTVSPDGFTSLPLLMLKMPLPIRDVFINYLKTTFDAHVSPLRLQPDFLSSTLETYFRHLSAPNSTQSIRDVVRQLQLQISFPSSTSLLKHIDITISGDDVSGFVKRGRLLQARSQTPFTAAITSYLQKHLALDLAHQKVHITKATCGSFTLSTDRLKLAVPEVSDVSMIDEDVGTQDASASQSAAEELYSSLVREATGTGRFLPESLKGLERASSTPSSNGNSRAAGARRKRAVSTTASANGNTKRSKARGKENGRRAEQDVDMN